MKTFAEKLDENRRNKQEIRASNSLTIARVSPSAEFSLAASKLAGTSLDISYDYLEQLKNYQKVYGNFQREKSGGASSSGVMIMISDGSSEPKNIDPTEMPKFEYKQPSLASVFSSSIIDMALLVLYNLIFFTGAFVSFIKFDLR